jgi:regulatory protein
MSEHESDIVLESVERRGRSFLLSFSDNYQIRATKGVIDRFRLAEGARFSPETYTELKRILEWEWAYYTAESMLARRPYSVGELKQRLRHKDISSDHIREIVRDFRERGFLNDYEYALARARSLADRKPSGRSYLISWLRKRLVPREIAEKAVDELLSDVNEVETAVELLKRKRSGLAKFDLETARRKAYTYLSRRAISYSAARAAFEKVFGKTSD